MMLAEFIADLRQKGVELWVEGEALRFRAPRRHATAELRAALRDHKEQLLAHLREAPLPDGAGAPDEGARFAPFPLTDIQHAYWVGRQGAVDAGGVAAHSYLELAFDGASRDHGDRGDRGDRVDASANPSALDLGRLETALRRLVEHHDMLRMVVLPTGEQTVLAEVPPLSITTYDLTGSAPDAVEAHLQAIRAEMSHQVLPAERWPLFDIRATRLPGGPVHLHLSLDLLVADAFSVQLLLQQGVALFQDPQATLPPPTSTFREYCLADARHRDPSSARYQRSLAHWRGRIETLPAAPALPLATEADAQGPSRFVRRRGGLDRASWRAFRDRAAAAGVTPSMAVCAAYGEVLRAFSREDRLTLNVTLFNRQPLVEDVERIVGDFTAGVLLEMDGSRQESFAERAQRVQEQLFEDLEHAVVSSVRVLREMARSSRSDAGAAMPYVFTSLLQDTGPSFPWGAGVRIVEAVSQTPQVWLDHQVFELDGALYYSWDAIDALFPPGLIDALFDAYNRLLRRLADDPGAWSAPARQPLPADQQERRAAFNATEKALCPDRLEALFLRRAAAQPDAPAVVAGDTTVSYGELERRSARIAAWLARGGAAPGRLVAIVAEKGPEQVIAALAVLRAGAAYLPIDPGLPAERLRFLLAEGQVELVLTQARLDASLPWPEGTRRLAVDRDESLEEPAGAPPALRENGLAYVIYTSGSTGRPKGVMIDHRGAVNTIVDVNERFGVSARDRVLALSSLSFDLSVYDLFGVLAAGGAIVMPEPGAARDPARWLSLLEGAGVTIWNSVPALMEMLVEHAEGSGARLPGSLRLALMSGDWIPISLPARLRALAGQAEVVSLGGATEASIWSILHRIGAVDPAWRSIPYGRPMANQRFHVLDAALDPCPEWVTGQLYIGGVGVALGYWRDATRTAERFIAHPRTGERLYATGDLGRMLPDGNIEFLGREDAQVKIEGYRVELGEIEAALVQHPEVQSAAVVAVGEARARRRLAAYVVAAGPRVAGESAPGLSADPAVWDALVDAGRRAAAVLPTGSGSIRGFMDALDRASAASICRTLASLGLFREPGEQHTVGGILERCGVLPRHEKLLRQWLEVLADDGLLERRAPDTFAGVRPLPAPRVDALWDEAAGFGSFSPKLVAYFQRCAASHAALLRGELDPLEILFPGGSRELVEELFQLNSVSRYYSTICQEIARGLADATPGRALRILEVGAGVGETTAAILAVLPPARTGYVLTDISAAFMAQARKKLAAYPFVHYARLDMNEPAVEQGFDPRSFDAIVIANVLHDARDPAQTLAQLRGLLAPDGLFLVVEGTPSARVLMVSVGFIEGLGAPEKERGAPDRWRALLATSGAAAVASFPEPGTPGEQLGKQVLLARVPAAGAAAAAPERGGEALHEALLASLRAKLPEYMVPSTFVTLAALPVTANGKIDRKALATLGAPEGRPGPAHEPPRTELERTLCRIWGELLALPDVGVRDNFFERGGDSLLAVQLATRIRAATGFELPLRVLFQAPTVEALAGRLRAQERSTEHAALPQIVDAPAERAEPFSLTDVQHAYWLGRTRAFELGGVACQVYLEFDGTGWEPARIEQAWNALIARHEMLRAVVDADGRQRILASVPRYEVEVLDLRGEPREQVSAELLAVREQMSQEPLDASAWPLFEIRLTRTEGERLRLHFKIDALIADGGSLFTLYREWDQRYRDPLHAAATPGLSFRDYVLALDRLDQAAPVERSRAYWQARLDTLPPAPDLPVALAPKAVGVPRFTRRSARLPGAAWQRLQQRARQAGLTPSGVLLAAYGEILSAWAASPRFTINVTLFNRLPLHPEVESIVGDFTTLSLTEVDLSSPGAFVDQARRLQEQLLQDLDHRHYSGVRVIRDLAARRSGEPRALMPVVFTSTLGLAAAERTADDVGFFGRVQFSVSQTPQVWLDHQVWVEQGDLILSWDALDGLFAEETLDAMFSAYRRFVERLADDDGAWRELARRHLPAAQEAVAASANATGAPRPEGLLFDGFLAQARRAPDAIAVRGADRALSYRELERFSRAVGLQIRARGVAPDRHVAIVMEKGVEQIVAALAIQRAGGAYLPIDPELPSARVHALLADGRVTLALTQRRIAERCTWPEGVEVMVVDGAAPDEDPAALDCPARPENLAYTIYTSGSTGRPKGVMVEHRAALGTLDDINRRFAVGPGDAVLALSSLSFDLSVYDLFGVLAAGATVVVPDASSRRDPAAWMHLLRAHRVTIWDSVPALMRMLVEHAGGEPLPDSLRLVLLSGDWIPVDLPDRIRRGRPALRVISLGGATEAAVWSIVHEIGEIPPGARSILYGKPLANQRFHVLDAQLRERPLGVPGELYIAGDGLARGYWSDATKTAERFLRHPATGERLYRTGDLGRRLPDGNIEFLGRDDFQVKIQGYRIELGEIEAVLAEDPALRGSVVLAEGSSRESLQLVAYVVPGVGPAEASRPPPGSGVLSDTAARLEQKLKHLELRPRPAGSTPVALRGRAVDAGLVATFTQRRSRRRFDPRPCSAGALGDLLACLRRIQLPGSGLSKHRYPSAGDLYPVRVYVAVRAGRVEGLEAGVYYYHPIEHVLDPVAPGEAVGAADHWEANRAIAEDAAFSLFLVGELAAIEPMYGDSARDFCLLEAGAVLQLLMQEAAGSELGLCPIGGFARAEALRDRLRLGPTEVLLHAVLGGVVEASEPATEPSTARSAGGRPGALLEELRARLAARLPAYMLPARFVEVAEIPLTANGKVDRTALASCATRVAPQARHHEAPKNDMERSIAAILRELLGLEVVGTGDNFFELGANSVRLVQVHQQIRARLGVEMRITDIFEHPTVERLATHLAREPERDGAREAARDEVRARADKQRDAMKRRRGR